MRIWKYVLKIDQQVVAMPEGSKVLSLQMQGTIPCLWALVDEGRKSSARRIAIYKTGEPIPDDPGEYIATFQKEYINGTLVFHVFESKV